MPLITGTAAGVEVSKTYRDAFRSNLESKIYGNSHERLRILWIQNRIQFKNSLVDLLEKEYGAAIVIDELNTVTWDPIDPNDPYKGMARRAISNPLNGKIKNRITHLQKLALDYRVDGAINPCNWGCRQGAGARGLITEGLKEIGVPVLNLEVDCVDPKNFSEHSFVNFKGSECIIPPNSFALASTVEYFRIPRNILTVCLGKSTYARCGIIVNVTPLEPEWEGHVTLEFSNSTPLPARIYANEGVAQMLFFESDEVCETSYKDRGGKYQGQTGVTLPKA